MVICVADSLAGLAPSPATPAVMEESITSTLHVVTKPNRKYHLYTTCCNKVQKKVSLVHYML